MRPIPSRFFGYVRPKDSLILPWAGWTDLRTAIAWWYDARRYRTGLYRRLDSCLVVHREVSNPFQLAARNFRGLAALALAGLALGRRCHDFHFIAGQFQMGAIQYRDIFDINMPLIYFVHAAVIAIGGMGDGGHAAAALPSTPRNSRRRMSAPRSSAGLCASDERFDRVGNELRY